MGKKTLSEKRAALVDLAREAVGRNPLEGMPQAGEVVVVPNKKETKRKPDGTFAKGTVPNPAGRPKGKTIKEFIREMLLNMTDDEKRAFIARIDPFDVIRLAEGNPHNTSDIQIGAKPIPLLEGVRETQKLSDGSSE